MISAVGPQNTKKIEKDHGFYTTPELEKEIHDSHATLVSGNPLNQSRIQVDKFLNAVTVYPVKGLTGNPNSNFYEFLTMGMVPYLIGSGMLMAVFNLATKYFEPTQAKHAASIGHKMALGVVFYGLLKSLSKKFIEMPVGFLTGVDVNKPYRDMKSQLPEYAGDTSDKKSIEYHKVFESVDFPRWDLLYDYKKNKPRNYYYDKVAKKMGLGKNLEASDQVAKPKIRELIIRTKTWTTLSSYIWAGLGVALAVQDGWTEAFGKKEGSFFKRAADAFNDKGKSFKAFAKEFAKDLRNGFRNSCKQLYNGGVNHSKVKAAAGKAYILAAIGSTVAGILMSSFDFFKDKTELDDARIDYKNDYTVS